MPQLQLALRRHNEQDQIIMFEKGPRIIFKLQPTLLLSGTVSSAEKLVMMTPENLVNSLTLMLG